MEGYRFHWHYVLNMLFTKEWILKNKNTFTLGGKMTTAGGRRYGPVDITASDRDKEVVWIDATRNSLQPVLILDQLGFLPLFYYRVDF